VSVPWSGLGVPATDEMGFSLTMIATLLSLAMVLVPCSTHGRQPGQPVLNEARELGGVRVTLGSYPMGSVTGRVRVYVAPTNSTPPFSQSADSQSTCQLYGVDVVDLEVGESVLVDGTSGRNAAGFPLATFDDLPPLQGWFVQAELAVYRWVTIARAEFRPGPVLIIVPHSGRSTAKGCQRF